MPPLRGWRGLKPSFENDGSFAALKRCATQNPFTTLELNKPGLLRGRAFLLTVDFTDVRVRRTFGLEGETGAELELARRVDGVGDQAKLQLLLLHTGNARHAWVSVLWSVADVIGGDIKAERLGFSEHKCLENGEVEIARAPGANVVQIGWSRSGSEGACGNGETGGVEPCGHGMRST
jgi:hypothetical protein